MASLSPDACSLRCPLHSRARSKLPELKPHARLVEQATSLFRSATCRPARKDILQQESGFLFGTGTKIV